MKSRLRALVLALLAVLAISAIAAQGASAVVEHEFVAGSGGEDSFVLTGEAIEGKHKFVMQGKVAECNVVEFAGTVKDENVNGVVDRVTVHPKYTGHCTFNGAAIHVSTKGCNYILDSDTTETEVGEHASLEIECEGYEEGEEANVHQIEITRTACVVKIEPNQVVDGMTYQHGGGSGTTTDLKIIATATGITYETSGIGCGLIGLTTGTHHDGEYKGTTTVDGYEDTGKVHGTTTSGTVFTHGDHVALSVTTP